MNFLLHYRFATEELEVEPLRVAGVGAMWPDLVRMAGHVVRPDSTAAATASIDGEGADAFAIGVAHHFEADRWFHRTAVFRDGERALSKAFLGTRTPKLVLFAHAAWEMCLDGSVVRAGGQALRSELGRAAEEAAPSLDRAARALVLDDEPRAAMMSRVARIHDALASGALYDDYASAEGIAHRLAGIRSGFGFPRPEPESFARWVEALGPSITHSDGAVDALAIDRAAHVLQTPGS